MTVKTIVLIILFMNAVIDASLAIQNLINSAEEFGLGICPNKCG